MRCTSEAICLEIAKTERNFTFLHSQADESVLSGFSGVQVCNPMGHSPSDYCVQGISLARILELIAISFSRGSSHHRDRTCVSYVSYTGRQVLYHQCHRQMRRSEFLSFLLDCFQFKILCTLSRNSEVVNLFPYIIYTNFLSVCMHAKSLQSCPTLCDLVDCRPPGSSVHGILQARILE